MRTISLYLVFFWLFLNSGRAQSFLPEEEKSIIENARKLLNTEYLQNLEILTHYEVNQPFDALRPQLQGFIKSAFRDADVQIFNEFREPLGTLTTVEEYIKDYHIFAKRKPIVNTLDWSKARFQLKQTSDKKPFLNVYILKKMQGSTGKILNQEHLVECRVQFDYNEKLKSFYGFKIAGITKVQDYPKESATDVQTVVAAKKNDLFAVLDTLTAQLKANSSTSPEELVLERFTYKKCGINDALSDQVFAALNSCIQRRMNVSVQSVAGDKNVFPIIRGWYEDAENQLVMHMELVDSRTGKVFQQLSNAELPLRWLEEQQIPLKPQNYQNVKVVQDTIRQITSVTPQSALKLEIRTDRGRTGVEYWAGQSMILEAKANRPCHVRLLYRLADGTQTLLENDFVIKPGQENQLVRIAPEASFICSAPYGTEYLLAYASEEPFCALPTVPNREGYFRQEGEYQIFVGSLSAFNTLMKCAKNSVIAEDHLQITTREGKTDK
ncbi:DUF4384 domain-containing protein [Siphonobacter sp. SORGH_AS_1065]|uniref:DUF4384 domain-containing protein n=1 Tax=Siphonobacter sp. SORGH_AS_1065 TaxID=3041795 RepID=UPI002781349D|nr:DUF4384 domain-containing protein [Siphonobacter sp. SORGH_AS_1065]MDQ1089704.1 hypothetical protein [Siphonobacter sp. SORGH_AS_1065]